MGQDVNRRDFVKSVTAASVAPLLLGGNMAAAEGTTAVLTVHFDRRIGVIDPRIFGHMTEETLTSYEGGVLSEMLYNRKFERGEERNIASNTVAGVLFKGTGDGWEPAGLSSGATLVLDQQVYYSPSQSQRITFSGGDVPAGIQQAGYQNVLPQIPASPRLRIENPLHLRPGERYRARLAWIIHESSGQKRKDALKG